MADWHRVTIAGCLASLERGAQIDGGALGLTPTTEITLPYRDDSEVWRDPQGRFALGAVTFPVEGGEGRRLCEVGNLPYLLPETVNATYSDFLDWAEVAQEEGLYRFEATRYNRDWLTGIANLTSTFETIRGRPLEVTFVAQPAEGRVTFSAVEMLGEPQ